MVFVCRLKVQICFFVGHQYQEAEALFDFSSFQAQECIKEDQLNDKEALKGVGGITIWHSCSVSFHNLQKVNRLKSKLSWLIVLIVRSFSGEYPLANKHGRLQGVFFVARGSTCMMYFLTSTATVDAQNTTPADLKI